MIRFQCPSCSAVYRVQDRDAGRKTACLKCRQRIQVPQPERKKTILGKLLPSRPLSGVPVAHGEVIGDWQISTDDAEQGRPHSGELRPGLSFCLSLASLTFALLAMMFAMLTSMLFVNYFLIPCNVLAIMFAVGAIATSGRVRLWMFLGVLMLVISVVNAVTLHVLVEMVWREAIRKIERDRLPPLHY